MAQRMDALGAADARPYRPPTFLPEPDPRARPLTIVSVDDHVVEPPDLFDGRMPARFADRIPRVVDVENGGQAWLYEGHVLPNVGLNAVAGRAIEEKSMEPTRFDHMRRGAWDVHARVRDMDIDGVQASLCFPSFLPGFGGGRIQTITDDREFALAAVRAYNSWHAEEWAGAYPDRFIPCQITWLHDPVLAADEVRANADRGFTALAFPESPERLGFPSLHTGHWDPLMRACEETGTVVCLHVGSGGEVITTSADMPRAAFTVVFGTYASLTAIDWLYSGIPDRFPELTICLSEGGIGWVPGLVDRLRHIMKYTSADDWPCSIEPCDMLLRNFRFCAVDDPTTFAICERIGPEVFLLEADYPHADGSWPDTQEHFRRQLDGLDAETVRRITWQNASELFRHPIPAAV